MRTTHADWDDIRERLKAGHAPSWKAKDLSEDQRESFLHATRMAFEAGSDNRVVQGLKRFIMVTAFASLDDVLYWHIEPTEGIEKAFRVRLMNEDRSFIGTLVPSVLIRGSWECAEYTPEEQGKSNDLEALQFVSNVIELKPDKKYLLAFKGLTHDQLDQIHEALRRRGYDCFCIALYEGQELQVIEAPAKTEPEPDPFWQQFSRDMTINERRAIFAKLAEHLGLAVDEWGNTDDGIKKQFSLDETKKILDPYKKIEDYL